MVVLCFMIAIANMGCAKTTKDPNVFEQAEKIENGVDFVSKEEDWSITLLEGMEKLEEEPLEDVGGLITYYKKPGYAKLVISEFLMPDMELTEETVKNEVEADSYFTAERFESIEVNGVGTYYGAVLKDNAVNTYNLHYNIKHGDKVISFTLYKQTPFTIEEEAAFKASLSTIKLN